MKKILIVLCVLLATLPVFGQDIDPDKIDLSKASMSLAGPEKIYVTNIYYQGVRLSVLLQFDGANGAVIYSPWYDDDKLLQDYYELGYAKLRVQDSDTLIISDVMLGNRGFSGRFNFDGVSKLVLDGAWPTMTPRTAEMEVADLQARLLVVRKRYEEQLRAADIIHDIRVLELETELAAARQAAADAGADTRVIDTATVPSRVRHSGFSGGRSLSGNWTLTSAGATQTDADAYFAKFMIPVDQSAIQTLYSFDAKAGGSGYAGYGLHFFASDELYGAGYGYGSSYLVWLTRDPNYHGTDATYVQLYRSEDDVVMIQLASAMIADSIGTENSTDVLYDRAAGTITISVNGVEYLDIAVRSPIRSGSKIALRALGGGVVFSDLTVSTK